MWKRRAGIRENEIKRRCSENRKRPHNASGKVCCRKLGRKRRMGWKGSESNYHKARNQKGWNKITLNKAFRTGNWWRHSRPPGIEAKRLYCRAAFFVPFYMILQSKRSESGYRINKKLPCIGQNYAFCRICPAAREDTLWSTEQSAKSISLKDITANLRENITENRHRITAVLRLSLMQIQQNLHKRVKLWNYFLKVTMGLWH